MTVNGILLSPKKDMIPIFYDSSSDDTIEYDINFLLKASDFNYSSELIASTLNNLWIIYVFENSLDDIKSLQSYNSEWSDSFFIHIKREDFWEWQLIISRFSKEYINLRLALDFDSKIQNHWIDARVIAIIAQFEVFLMPAYISAWENLAPYIPENDTLNGAEYVYISDEFQKVNQYWTSIPSLPLSHGLLYLWATLWNSL